MNLRGTYTLAHRQIRRVLRIWRQSFLPTGVTVFLYFVVFGSVLGARMGGLKGVDYVAFMAPGLMMMQVITNAYTNTCFSLFSERYHHSFLELLAAPLEDYEVVFGFVMGGVFRGLVTAALVFLIGLGFATFPKVQILALMCVIITSSVLFSVLGVLNGLFARNFDDTGLVPAFVLTPLTFLSGVFFPLDQLGSRWQFIASYNPMSSICAVYRHVMIDEPLVYAWWWHVLMWWGLTFVLSLWVWYVMNRTHRVRA